MKTILIGRQMDVPEDVKTLCEKKLAKYDKFFRDDAAAHVTLSRKRNRESVEVTVSSAGVLFRSEEEAETFQTALDAAMASLERQIRKHKTKLEKRLREGAFLKDAAEEAAIPQEKETTPMRIKSFDPKPMTVEDAIIQMDLLGHSFFVFVSSESGDTEVVYTRKDGGYGLIVPSK